MTLLSGILATLVHSRHILYACLNSSCTKDVKTRNQKTVNFASRLMEKCTWLPAHVHTLSNSHCNVTRSTEIGSTAPAGWKSFIQDETKVKISKNGLMQNNSKMFLLVKDVIQLMGIKGIVWLQYRSIEIISLVSSQVNQVLVKE